MQFKTVGSHTPVHSNSFYNAATIAQPRNASHLDTTLPNTQPIQPRRPRPTMLFDDTIVSHSTDTETLEHVIEYSDSVGNTVMTLTIDLRTWAHDTFPTARKGKKREAR